MRSAHEIKNMLSKPTYLVIAISTGVLFVALLILVATSWHSLQLIKPVQRHLEHLEKIQDTARMTQGLLIRQFVNEGPPTINEIHDIQNKLTHILEQKSHLDAKTPTRLAKARIALTAFNNSPHAALIATLAEIRAVINNEAMAQRWLITNIHTYSLSELRIAIAALIAIPALILLSFYLLRHRIMASANRLSVLLERLSLGQFVAVPVDEGDEELKPVLKSYNMLVQRLKTAEAENEQRRGALEHQVRTATQTVLQQSAQLADLDRLAMVGETTAHIAHELRNPLAGIEIALRNLKVDCQSANTRPDPKLYRRIDPIIAELQRMSRLLTDLLECGRSTPERAVRLDIAVCINETVSLVRYQTPHNTEIKTTGENGLFCTLPADTLRQIIFNLLLNAVQVIGDHSGSILVKAQHRGSKAVLVIEDNGPGFPEEIMTSGPRTFMTRRKNGTGLGLTTVKRLVEGIGGHLELANRPEGGARVSLSLPCGENNA